MPLFWLRIHLSFYCIFIVKNWDQKAFNLLTFYVRILLTGQATILTNMKQI